MSAKLQQNKQLSAPKGVLHRGNIVIWERGSGESVSFAVIAVCVCTLLLFLIGIIQLNVGMKQLAQAASVASRAAAVCGSMEDAEELAQQVAESSITNGMVSGMALYTIIMARARLPNRRGSMRSAGRPKIESSFP